MSSQLRITIPVLKVLDAMLYAPDAEHWGFEIMKATGLKSGTLYPILARLETAGWVTSAWGEATERGGPRRRYYRLTGIGASSARIELARAPGRGSKASAVLPSPLRPATGLGGAR